MSIDFHALAEKPRILIEAALKPVAGTRFQPTGFPDLGAATYDAPPTTDEQKQDYPNGVPTLLVESAQSMANRLEAVCWDEGEGDVVADLKGLPYVRVTLKDLNDGTDVTTSLGEFHRLNSPYIMQKSTDSMRSYTPSGRWFRELILEEMGLSNRTDEISEDAGNDATDVIGVVNLRRLAKICFKYDPNSLIHGVFLEKLAGRLRHPRALSSFIEASGVGRADSGGVKFDNVLPSKNKELKLEAKEGYTNVPFHRTEFTAKSITAFFSIDLAQIRGYGLGDDATQLLIALSLWKVRKFLESSMRLRSACELELVDEKVVAKRPDQFALPDTEKLKELVGKLLKKCRPQFADPLVTELVWQGGKKAEKSAKKTGK